MVLGLGGYIVYDNFFIEKDSTVDNEKDVNDEEKNDLIDNVDNNNLLINNNIFNDYRGELGWIAIVSIISKIDNIDLFSDSYYRNLFVMENIIKNEGGLKNFLEVTPKNAPCCLYYYSYDKFVDFYTGIFNEKYSDEADVIEGNNYVAYDYYRRFGANGVYAENINVVEIVKENDVYIASVEIFYTEESKRIINDSKISATIKYIKENGKIVFKGFIINS